MVDQYDYSEIYNEQDENEIIFKVYIKEIELNLKDFNMKPNFLPKRISNSNDFSKILSIAGAIAISPLEVYYKVKYQSYMKICNEEEKCSICLDLIYDIDKNWDFYKVKEHHYNLNEKYTACCLKNCMDHFFHVECLNNMIGSNRFLKCPICSKIYGKQTGTQPKGTMKAYIMKGVKCEGFNCDTICIDYNFPDGTSRNAYLPYNRDGMKILGLLKEAFDRKLVFTVGTSVTTGRSNTTVWAGIHHKTSISGGTSCFGYPDPSYFSRVEEELASKGVTEESMNESAEALAGKFLSKKESFDSDYSYNINKPRSKNININNIKKKK